MRRILLFTIYILGPLLSFTQVDPTTAKAYRNQVDYKNENPLFETKFQYKLKEHPKFYDSYCIKSKKTRIKRKDIKYSIWIISDGDYLYLNGTRHGFQDGYIKFKKGSNYYYFHAKPVYSVSQKKKMLRSTESFGFTGYTVSSIKIDKENSKREHNVLNLKKGTTDILNQKYIKDLLIPYPELLKEFNSKRNNDNLEVLKSYLVIVNNKTAKS